VREDHPWIRRAVRKRPGNSGTWASRASSSKPQSFPEELGGARHFEHVSTRSDWSPTNEHFPLAKRDGGRKTPDNSVLAHRLCNRLDFSIATERSHRRDLERIKKAREAATPHRGTDPPPAHRQATIRTPSLAAESGTSPSSQKRVRAFQILSKIPVAGAWLLSPDRKTRRSGAFVRWAVLGSNQ
jgi:hypothetical protein